MFKHVELMRKSAIRIMSKTYGGRSKDDMPIYDAYPLRSLSHLLCFESLEEARTACEHYGITVKSTKIRTDSGKVVEDVIFWRISKFREPIDQEKATVIPLAPRKMVKTIESKLHGATRLKVCRGQTGGQKSLRHLDGKSSYQARVSPTAYEKIRSRSSEAGFVNFGDEERARADTERVSKDNAVKKAELEAIKACVDAEAKLREEEEARIADATRREAELKAAQDKEREIQKAAERAEIRRRQEEIEARKKAEDAVRQKAEAAAREEKARRDAEAQAKLLDEERRRKETEERAQRERERRDQELAVEQARLAAAEEERRQAAQMREERKWLERRCHARKQIILGRWLQNLPSRNNGEELIQIPDLRASFHQSIPCDATTSLVTELAMELSLHRSIELCLKFDVRLPVARWVHDSLASSFCLRPATILLNIGVLLAPSPNSTESVLAHSWILTRMQHNRHVADGLDVRVSVQEIHQAKNLAVIDGLLVLDLNKSDNATRLLVDEIDERLPVSALKLFPHGELASKDMHVTSCNDLSPESLESTLQICLRDLAARLAFIPQVSIERFSLSSVCFMLSQHVAETAQNMELQDDILVQLKIALQTLVDYLDELGISLAKRTKWPSSNFSSDGHSDTVHGYFEDGSGLPLNWLSSLQRYSTTKLITDLLECFTMPMEDSIGILLSDAPDTVREESQAYIDVRDSRRALLLALRWRQEAAKEPPYIYIPRGMLGRMLQETARLAKARIIQHYPVTSKRHACSSPLRHRWLDVGSGSPVDIHRDVSDDLFKAKTFDSVNETSRPSSSPKRSRDDESEPLLVSKRTRTVGRGSSLDVKESRNFTKKLEAYLSGAKTSDAFVAARPLSSFLRGAPNVELP